MFRSVSEPWVSLLEGPHVAQAAGLLRECRLEVAEGHPLYGSAPKVVARCTGCDDVVVRLADDQGFGVVHLTWSGNAEAPPFPRINLLPTFLALEAVMDQHDH